MKIRQESLLSKDNPDYDYSDNYKYTIIDKNNKIDITQIAECFIAPGPKWVEGLLVLRNRIVSVFKLKTPATIRKEGNSQLWEIGSQAGIFKVFGKTATEIILGEDDRHLDFRVSLLLEQNGQRKTITVTTVVKYHNGLGRCYFFFVKPIHRIIVPLTLKPKFRKLESDISTKK